jgi:hypothetical protein
VPLGEGDAGGSKYLADDLASPAFSAMASAAPRRRDILVIRLRFLPLVSMTSLNCGLPLRVHPIKAALELVHFGQRFIADPSAWAFMNFLCLSSNLLIKTDGALDHVPDFTNTSFAVLAAGFIQLPGFFLALTLLVFLRSSCDV